MYYRYWLLGYVWLIPILAAAGAGILVAIREDLLHVRSSSKLSVCDVASREARESEIIEPQSSALNPITGQTMVDLNMVAIAKRRIGCRCSSNGLHGDKPRRE
jgi:hypothetical protein